MTGNPFEAKIEYFIESVNRLLTKQYNYYCNNNARKKPRIVPTTDSMLHEILDCLYYSSVFQQLLGDADREKLVDLLRSRIGGFSHGLSLLSVSDISIDGDLSFLVSNSSKSLLDSLNYCMAHDAGYSGHYYSDLKEICSDSLFVELFFEKDENGSPYLDDFIEFLTNRATSPYAGSECYLRESGVDVEPLTAKELIRFTI